MQTVMPEEESRTIASLAYHKQMQLNAEINILTAQLDKLLEGGVEDNSTLFNQLTAAIDILELESKNWYAVMMEMID